MVLKTYPPLEAIASRMMASCRSRATCIAPGYFSQSFVLPSMSVNRKVTSPVGMPSWPFCARCGCEFGSFSDTQLPIDRRHDTTAAGRLHRDQDYRVTIVRTL